MDIKELLHRDLAGLIQTIGYIGVFTIVFVESGLLIGFFLPGDSLLFTAGFLASQGFLISHCLLLGVLLRLFLVIVVGITLDTNLDVNFFQKEDSLLFHKDHLRKAEVFYEKHGGKTIIIARFMPFIRTFAPVVAGMAEMRYSTFVSYNVIGGVLWAIGLTLVGYFFGNIPIVKQNFELVIFSIIILSVLPAVYHVVKEPGGRRAILKLLKLSK